ncbi:V-type ATP synthase subunit E [Anaerocolumna sp. AGMB13020]|uniref:V-type ATP synthase subunit E n=1 Tax=Anaerocolumna sp. AGMB13020 TaxID=3081750 RepID=UPI002955278D|nr:V-type ATP synthase subunit E [Anaerocolumna sp. AGMB13020]WOO37655.1 V-type ATP synthase subunit E [Anaerocolumna sp. AGMB13020]
MGSLESLTHKIIEDAKLQAEDIIKQALDKISVELEDEAGKNNIYCEKIKQEAERKAEEIYRRVIAEKEMEIRDKNLFVKQKQLDNVFHEALRRLKDLSLEEYIKYLRHTLSGKDLKGYEIFLPEKYNTEENDKAIKELFNKISESSGVLSDIQYRPIGGGFILMKNGVVENYTFETWIDIIRQDAEGEVLEILYGKGK